MSWPFATLIVNKDRLELKASVMGSYIFTRSWHFYYSSRQLGGGIRINHFDAYNKDIIFLSSRGTDNLINSIRETGFFDDTITPDAYTIAEISHFSGFAIKTPAVIGIVVIWNLLFLIDFRHFFIGDSKVNAPGFRLYLTIEPVQEIC
jgi:hypothetical protein